MNQLLLEGRLLVGIVCSVTAGRDSHIVHKRLDWERMYRLADYHKVANIIYLGILGNGEALPSRWKDAFFERYRESLLYEEQYADSLREVLTCLDMHGLSPVILSGEEARGLYLLPELAGSTPVRLFLGEEQYLLAKGYLVDLGYETRELIPGAGEVMGRTPGLKVELYCSFPFRIEAYRKNMLLLTEKTAPHPVYRNLRCVGDQERFLMQMAAAAYHYVSDELTVREVLDLFLKHKACREMLEKEAVQVTLSAFRAEKLADKLLRLSYMWFGNENDDYFKHLPEEIDSYDALENRLLTKGILRREEDEQALHLEQMIARELERERRKEMWKVKKAQWVKAVGRFRKQLRWVFPDLRYMGGLYPILEKVPVVLPFCWILRGIRLIRSERGM